MALKRITKVFSAMSDGTRLRILALLSKGELCVCDMILVLDVPQSKISRHLGYLRRARLVEGQRQGLWMHYRLSPAGRKFFQAMVKAVRGLLREFRRDWLAFSKNRNCLVGRCK